MNKKNKMNKEQALGETKMMHGIEANFESILISVFQIMRGHRMQKHP